VTKRIEAAQQQKKTTMVATALLTTLDRSGFVVWSIATLVGRSGRFDLAIKRGRNEPISKWDRLRPDNNRDAAQTQVECLRFPCESWPLPDKSRNRKLEIHMDGNRVNRAYMVS
jgi:hypothetical protein